MSQLNPSRPEGESPSHIDAEVQREIDEALQGQSIEELMEQSAPPPPSPEQSAGDAAASAPGAPREFHHEIRRGRISAIRGEDVFVEIAGEASKMQGIVPLIQFEHPPRIGSIMDFVIDRADETQGLIFLSREGAVSRSTWEQLQRGAVVEARVVATNKGGLELEMIGGIRAFMPASQIDLHHVKDLEPLIGEKLEGLVQEIDRKSKKVVLSRRLVLQQRREQAREKLLAEIEPGKILDGTVSNIVDFGAFVDIGGVDGLVHVSDLSYTHVDKPSEVLKVGQAVRVKVLKIDREHDRISLGLKQVEPDPWEGVEGRVRPGQSVEGKVIRTANFGAFVEILPGIEGLLPLSEMSWRRIHRAEDVVKAGDSIRLAVLQVDPAKRRISLSLKQSQGDPWIGAERKFAAGSVAEGTVLSTTDFGAFIELESGVEGLVHISELADRRVGRVEDVVKVGDPVKVRVLEISEDDRKIRLSIKQVDKPAPPQATAEEIARHSAPAQTATRRPPKDLKGGMGKGGGLGKGLGGLSLDDFK